MNIFKNCIVLSRKAGFFACAALCLFTFFTPAVHGTPIQYLVISANPASGGIFSLPNYGNVQVTHNYLPASDFIRLHQTGVENKSAGLYTWGADTDRFNIVNSNGSAGTFLDYTLTFDFLDGQPDVSRLLLVVVGLAANTTATVSEAGNLVGEFHFPPALPGGTSTTLINGKVLSSKNDGDPVNTGWALYQPSTAFTSLSLAMHHQAGDGVGWTLAYTVPEPSSLLLLMLGISALIVLPQLRSHMPKRRASEETPLRQ